MNYDVRFIAKTWEHHSAHSGYHQLIQRLGSVVQPLDLSSVRYTWIPGRLAVRMAERSGVKYYDYAAFFHEWAAFRDLLTHKLPTICHVIYGDESFRYLGQFPLPKKHRVVATYHQPPDSLNDSIKNRDFLRTLDAVIVVGTNQIPFFDSVVDPSRLFWVPHGVDTSVFKPSFGSKETATREKICLFVGMHKRDFQTLIRVIEFVGHEEPGAVFNIVTARSNAHLFDSFPNVRLFCDVAEDKLVSLYQEATLLLQPLMASTANNAILEGMACGLPIVATDVGGVRDYANEQCAALTPLQDACEMAKSILDLLTDEPRRTTMALHARSRALQFDWEVVATQMQRVYETVL